MGRTKEDGPAVIATLYEDDDGGLHWHDKRDGLTYYLGPYQAGLGPMLEDALMLMRGEAAIMWKTQGLQTPKGAEMLGVFTVCARVMADGRVTIYMRRCGPDAQAYIGVRGLMKDYEDEASPREDKPRRKPKEEG